MRIEIRSFESADIDQVLTIWNQIVLDGIAFPQTECLTKQTGDAYFRGQSFTGVAVDSEHGQMVGVYTLHPNNVGRCGHICNASYAVGQNARGQGVGELLVRHCMAKAKEVGFRILQFNAVVKTNTAALHLYEKLGFTQLGVIPGGFRLEDGRYEDIIPHFIVL
jgi:L-amino acid N-acyltransferase YncA